ncbi:MAG: heavy metal transport/detoxification protein [Solirubrobacterales bacterium]|nr:MAG: heavy metal transport/detoxification protein [Solirubrobacterales bacterium]
MTESTLTVPDMSCEACVATVQGALESVPGVAHVSVDLEQKLVSVEHDEGVAPAARLAAAVEEQGYPVTGTERS